MRIRFGAKRKNKKQNRFPLAGAGPKGLGGAVKISRKVAFIFKLEPRIIYAMIVVAEHILRGNTRKRHHQINK